MQFAIGSCLRPKPALPNDDYCIFLRDILEFRGWSVSTKGDGTWLQAESAPSS